jgi:hypothetical protein
MISQNTSSFTKLILSQGKSAELGAVSRTRAAYLQQYWMNNLTSNMSTYITNILPQSQPLLGSHPS